jgi:hypothetical protein
MEDNQILCVSEYHVDLMEDGSSPFFQVSRSVGDLVSADQCHFFRLRGLFFSRRLCRFVAGSKRQAAGAFEGKKKHCCLVRG